MSRRPRIEYPGAIYHVYQRGNNKRFIFESDFMKKFFLVELESLKAHMDFEVFGYAIMNNHNHLLIQTNGDLLSSIMHRINSRFSRCYNDMNEHINHVFGDRYGAILVTNERYLLWSLRYIHQNPIKAGLCNSVQDFRWNSDKYYRYGVNGLVNADFILDMLSSYRKEAVKVYSNFMLQQDEKEYNDNNLYELEQEKLDIGLRVECPKNFMDYNIKPSFEQGDLYNPANTRSVTVESIDRILNRTIPNPLVLELVLEGRKTRSLTPYKLNFAAEAYRLKYTLKQIASKLNMSEAAVYRLLSNSDRNGTERVL